jgi:methylthioribulose-1-phosphate dehydratase
MSAHVDQGDEFSQRAAELIAAGRFFHERGWVPATSGNFSARLGSGEIAITVSGRHKGRLTQDDIMRVDDAGRSLDGKKSSAETLLHTHIYQRYPNVGSVLHPHSPNGTVISLMGNDEVVLAGYELLKVLDGINTHATHTVIPIVANDQDMVRLSSIVDKRLDAKAENHGYLIAGHGLYTWGSTVEDAIRHVEALEAMFEIQLRLMALKQSQA